MTDTNNTETNTFDRIGRIQTVLAPHYRTVVRIFGGASHYSQHNSQHGTVDTTSSPAHSKRATDNAFTPQIFARDRKHAPDYVQYPH